MPLRPRPGRRSAGALLATALAFPVSAAAQSDAAPLARLTFVEHGVETGVASWEQAVEGRGFDIGQQLRTGP